MCVTLPDAAPDYAGLSEQPAVNQPGQRLEQLNTRDGRALIRTAMQNIPAKPSETVLSGLLDLN